MAKSQPKCKRCSFSDPADQILELADDGFFNVPAALAIVQRRPRRARQIPLATLKAALHGTYSKKHLDHVNPTDPGIIGNHKGYKFLLDGNHRARRVVRDGLPYFPAYRLTEAETKRVFHRTFDGASALNP